MIMREFHQHLQTATDRLRLARRRNVLAQSGAIAALIGAACLAAAYGSPANARTLQVAWLLGTAVLFARAWMMGRRKADDLSATVRQLESRYPELQARLLTAVEQHPDVFSGRFHLLQTRLLEDVSAHARQYDWAGIVSLKSLNRGWRRQAAAFAALLLVSVGLMLLPRPTANNATLPGATISAAAAGLSADYVVDPGNTQVERHHSLLVLLRFHSAPPRDAVLHWQPAGMAPERISMTKSLDDPVFAGRVPSIAGEGTYQLEFDGILSPAYQVKSYDLPALVSSSITIEAPAYTHREPQVFESAASVTMIEGSRIRLDVRVNKPLAQVELRDAKDGTRVSLSPVSDEPHRYQAVWPPDRSRRWELVLTDTDGRKNRDAEEFVIEVVPNRRPDLKPIFPGQDQRVSPLQEIALEAKTSDDFGILSTGLLIDAGKGETQTIPLTAELAGGEAHALTHLLSLENFEVEPGELVSFAFFAEDFGPDGEPRRTIGDLFFLEVRPFEETFREMESAGGKSGMQGAGDSPGQQFDKLIEMQKQIVSATWNLFRRDPDLGLPSEQAVVETLRESQSQAREQFEKLSESLSGNVPQERLDAVAQPMDRAVSEFTSVQEAAVEAKDHLTAALPEVRAAFQGLIRLKPTDHRIMQGGQSGAGGGGGGGMSQQQLDQLELSEEQNRYETEKTARKADQTPQKEQLAVLNRLKELAQRQQGLNEKLKELDAELRTAKTASERDELDRQLKQLRDEQQDLLQDADALRNKMQQSADPSQTAETRKQLEETRQQLVDAAESLQEGKLAQALNSGTRAERDLQRMQDEFRKQTSAQLTESLQQLRDQARELTEAEDKAADELARLGDQTEKSLRQRQQRQKLADALEEQRERLEETLKSVREFVQAAESSEPLASKKLYEAARNAQQQKTEEALSAAAQLVRKGFVPEATQVEQLARTGLQTLREGIDAAAESILGDEVEDLKRAKRELADLSKELQQEMQSARGEGASPAEAAENAKPGTNGQPGEPAQGQPTGAEKGQPGNSEKGQTPGGKTPGQQPGEGSPGESPAAGSGDSPSPGEGPSSESLGEGSSGGPGKPGGLRGGKKPQPKTAEKPGPGTSQPGNAEGGQGGGPGGQGGPLTGGNYSNWSDRLRDVESLLQDPELQAEVAKVREQARGIRADYKRHSQLPNWDLVEDDVQKPLVELQRRLAEEIAKRESPESLAPTDRDPVPQRYRELVRKYYERLGSGSK